MLKFLTSIVAPLVFFSFSLSAQEISIPPIKKPVTDLAGMVDSTTEAKLDRVLRQLRQRTRTQLAVLTVPSLEGLPIENYSIQVVDQWKLGDEGKDNGVLLLVSKGDRRLRIEVGRGLEGDLTDVESHRIINNLMVPLLKKGKPSDGILLGVAAIVDRIHPDFRFEVTYSGRLPKVQKVSTHSWFKTIFIIFFFIFLMLGNRSGLAGFFLGAALGGGGSRGGGGGFGGGFGGGGGGFGGGGASGSW